MVMQTYLIKDLGIAIILDGGWDHSPVTCKQEKGHRDLHTKS